MSTPENAARARAAKAAKAASAAARPAEGEIVAFAVVKTERGFVPMRLRLHAGTAFEATPAHEPMPYEALAYHYLQGDVTAFYEAEQRSRAHDAAKLDRDRGPSPDVGRGAPVR